MIRKVIFFVLLLPFLFGIFFAASNYSRVERALELQYPELEPLDYDLASRRAARLFAGEKLYIVSKWKTRSAAHYDGSDGSGRKKLTLDIFYDKNKNMRIRAKVLIEGDYATAQAEQIADNLQEKITTEYNGLFKKSEPEPQKLFLFF